MRNYVVRQHLYKLNDEFYYFRKRFLNNLKFRGSIMTSEQTVHYIIKNKCSIARYGDGEFDLMLQKNGENYQKVNPKLAERLLNVFVNPNKDLLICIPKPMQSTRGLKGVSAQFWKYWGAEKQSDVVCAINERAPKGYKFGDSFVSRPFSGYKNPKHAENIFGLLKQVWKDRDLLIVEGSGTRLGIGNDLFENADSIKRIIAPPENAFDYYDSILREIYSVWKGELVILALGPTATVLASDLAKMNIQSLDLGHIDIQYMWYLSGVSFQPVAGKYTNETLSGREFAESYDKSYQEQIVVNIGIDKKAKV
jgi:glycosyltransferase family protein